MSLEINILEESFDLIAPRGDELMDEFYSRLFEAAPAVRPLFPDDMRKQKAMLLGALVLVRKSLRDLGPLVPKLHAMGARHVAYGAKPEYYPLVGSVLIDSMAAVAGEAWTPEIETIIDTPPIDLFADAISIAAQCDSAIVVVDLKTSRRGAVSDAVERLRRSGTVLLGLVINRAPTPRSRRFYRYRLSGSHTVPR